MEHETYQTKDLYESAFLYASGQKLLGLIPENRYFIFEFADKSACDKSSTLYWQGDASVNAKKLSDAIKTLKDLMFSKTK